MRNEKVTMNESGSNTSNTKQQIVEKIQGCNNILVTVSDSPSVDELSAALGLTILLNNMKKHATAVFSGHVPRAIDFLEPGKTFENSVDSLRDFIIALDKEKADHLSYKVDGEIVRISITPYRTTITSKDLEFSQGDYNIELVLALGVRSKSQLDRALEAHGRILHDASVVSVVCGDERSELGSIGWREQGASSLCEMIVGLSEQLKNDAAKLDEQTATALLTGIVSATERFSNNLTSSKTMTYAAKLMQAGANQQLIAINLAKPEPVSEPAPDTDDKPANKKKTQSSDDNKSDNSESKSQSDGEGITNESSPQKTSSDAHPTTYPISHEKSGDLDDVGQQTASENQAEATQAAEDTLSQLTAQATSAAPTIDQLQRDMAKQLEPISDSNNELSSDSNDTNTSNNRPAKKTKASKSSEQSKETLQGTPLPAPAVLSGPVSRDMWEKIPDDAEPLMSGVLNATTDEAAAISKRLLNDTHNKTILNHGDSATNGVGFTPPPSFKPIDPALLSSTPDETTSYNDFGFTDGLKDGASDYSENKTARVEPIQPPSSPSANDEQTNAMEAALKAAEASAGSDNDPIRPLGDASQHVDTPNVNNSAASPDFDLPLPPMPPPLPDFTATLPAFPAASPATEPEHLGDILSPTKSSQSSDKDSGTTEPQQTPPSGPGQFKIPGQG